MRRRVLILPLAALVIAGLCAWRVSRPPRPVSETRPAVRAMSPAAGFLLLDQHSHPVKLERYIGRQPVLVRFVGAATAGNDPVLLWLRDHHAAVASAGYEVIGVTAETPLTVRTSSQHSGRDWPFPVVSDIVIGEPRPVPLHALWGRVDPVSGEPRGGLFEIDRAGAIEYDGATPRPIDDPLAWIARRVEPMRQ